MIIELSESGKLLGYDNSLNTKTMKKIVILTLVPLVLFFSCQKVITLFGGKSKSKLFGIDVSQYQGSIIWDKVGSQTKHPIKFAIIRATMGDDRKDCSFKKNTAGARKEGLIVGAYHYYDPNESSTEQAKNFIASAKLSEGDILPILDIEKLSGVQSTTQLRAGVKNWLKIVGKHYNAQPIIYTGYNFYQKHLMSDATIRKYPLWIAAYSQGKRDSKLVRNCEIHQFTEQVCVPGITGLVDGDDIKTADLEKLRIKKSNIKAEIIIPPYFQN